MFYSNPGVLSDYDYKEDPWIGVKTSDLIPTSVSFWSTRVVSREYSRISYKGTQKSSLWCLSCMFHLCLKCFNMGKRLIVEEAVPASYRRKGDWVLVHVMLCLSFLLIHHACRWKIMHSCVYPPQGLSPLQGVCLEHLLMVTMFHLCWGQNSLTQNTVQQQDQLNSIRIYLCAGKWTYCGAEWCPFSTTVYRPQLAVLL